MSALRLTLVILVFALGRSAGAATIWDEAVSGDLSGDRLAPTTLVLSVGANVISGTTTAGDVDYFTFTVPVGTSFTQLTLSAYSALDLAFLAIQNGSVITETPAAPNVANLLGWVHIGPTLVNTDILDNMAVGAGAQGFSIPLGAGPYAFWAQQTGASLTSYSFTVNLVPEPSVAALVALGLGGLAVARRKWEPAAIVANPAV